MNKELDIQDIITKNIEKSLTDDFSDGEEIVVLQTVAIVATMDKGKIVVQELIPHVVI
ncbi:hypothetical protein NDS46_30265 (plasmid) [Paenibacillus thiaminolyticus]|uniref:hypothetical protein n=1 Tax=Paenibacillus thiaminolyticus TaxID=49283 RepID=UPI00232A92A1|nr:hypothetical protein [Paenibacillus thiaminolyticus]WCF11633.1 hypothetical protein NDS46_30265 [Paenibacillus thiaminolyticus]